MLVTEDEGSLCLFRWRVRDARARLEGRARRARPQAPVLPAVFDLAAKSEGHIPADLILFKKF